MNEERIMQEVENALVKGIRNGEIFKLGYDDRISLIPFAKSIFEKIDMKRVEQNVIVQIENVVAEKIVSKFVTEMGTDMKKLFENITVRDDIRFYMRKNIEKMLDAIREVKL